MSDFAHELRADIPRILVEVVPGEPLTVTLPILDSTGADVPVDDAGLWSARAHVRADWRRAEVLHTFTTGGADPSAAFVEAAAGAVTLTATASDTAGWQTTWDALSAVADMFVTDPAGEPHCLADLVFVLLPRTTREE